MTQVAGDEIRPRAVKAAIPLVGTYRTGHESEYVEAAMRGGSLAGGGTFGARCEQHLRSVTASPIAMLTSSCSSALHMAGQILGVGPGKEIIVPSLAFASCASVFLSLGARVVFADSGPESPNVSEASVQRLVTRRTAAVLVIHYGGIACSMDNLLALSERFGVPIIEDCAHALFGHFHGRPLGSMGALAVLSFDYAKNVTCGEGGALLVNDRDLAEAAEVVYHRGTNRARMLRGESNQYELVGAGGNYSASELQAAYLYAQLRGSDAIQQRRAAIWTMYQNGLNDWACSRGVKLPACPPNSVSAYHLFYLIYPNEPSREKTIAALAQEGIATSPHYLPLHLSPAGRLLGGRVGDCPIAEQVSTRLLRLPFHQCLSNTDVERVIDAVQRVDLSYGR